MTSLITHQIDHDFSELHERMQWHVDQELIPCCATLVMHGTDVVDVSLFEFMDLETREPLRADAICRIYSNTKLITSVAAMILQERGLFDLDDPIEMYLPEFEEPEGHYIDVHTDHQQDGTLRGQLIQEDEFVTAIDEGHEHEDEDSGRDLVDYVPHLLALVGLAGVTIFTTTPSGSPETSTTLRRPVRRRRLR